MNSILFLIIFIPIIEIYLFIKIGSQIGAINNYFTYIFNSNSWNLLCKYEGLNTLSLVFHQLSKNETPAYEVLSGAAIAFAALLLIIPGFATDIFGFFINISNKQKIYI